jgi:high-affinity nickel-transport protein
MRKLWYNLTITGASVIVAVFIGGVEALGLMSDKLELQGPFWQFVGGLNDNLAYFGYAVVAIFIMSWAVSVIIYRAKGYDTLQVDVSA